MLEEVLEEVVPHVGRGVLPAVTVEHGHAGDVSRGALLFAPWNGFELAIHIVFVVKSPTAGDGPPCSDGLVITALGMPITRKKRLPGLLRYLHPISYRSLPPELSPYFFSSFSCFFSSSTCGSRLPNKDFSEVNISSSSRV